MILTDKEVLLSPVLTPLQQTTQAVGIHSRAVRETMAGYVKYTYI